MNKELSLETCEILFKKNCVKAADLDAGKLFAFFENEHLYMAESIVHCDTAGCKSWGYVNGGLIDAATTPESALQELAFVHAPKTFVGQEIGCYDADGSGDVLCPECACKRQEGGK